MTINNINKRTRTEECSAKRQSSTNWTITKLSEIIYSTAENLLWPRRLSNYFGNLRYKWMTNSIWRLGKQYKLGLIIWWHSSPFKGHSSRTFHRQFIRLYLDKDLPFHCALGRALSERVLRLTFQSLNYCVNWAGHLLHLLGPQFPHLYNKQMQHNCWDHFQI